MRSRGDNVILCAAVKGPTPSLGQPDHYGLESAKPGPQWMFRKPAAGQRPVCGATYAISRRPLLALSARSYGREGAKGRIDPLGTRPGNGRYLRAHQRTD